MTQLQDSPSISAPLKQQKNAKRLVLAATCLALFMTNFDGTAGDVALPKIQQDLGANISGVQWILNAYHLPVASLLLAMGKFGDVFGRRRIFLWGLALFTAASAMCGLAPNLEMLIVGRSLQGIGAAALLPLSLTILTATFTENAERTKAIGIWSAVSALAMVVGPGLGGYLIDAVGWQSIFIVNVPIGILTCAMSIQALKRDRGVAGESLDWPGLLLSILSVALLSYALTYESESAWLSSARLVWLGLSVLSFIAFRAIEKRSTHPIVPISLLANRAFALVCITQMLVFFMSGGLFFILSLFLQHVQGYSAIATGLCFLPMNGAIIAASFASGWIAVRLGWRFPILTGLAIVTAAVASLTQIDTGTNYSEILWTLVIAGFGGGLTIPALAATAMNAVTPLDEGIASALSSISIQFGGILGIAVQGALFAGGLRAQLGAALERWNFSQTLQETVMKDSLRYLNETPAGLPVPTELFQSAIRDAFVVGLEDVLALAAIALVVGIILILCVPKRVTPANPTPVKDNN